MNRTELKFLKSLRDAPADGLSWSRRPISCQDLLTRLCTCGAVQIVPGRQGKRLRVADAVAFAKVIQTASPLGLSALEHLPMSRADAVLHLGNAESVRAGNVQGVFVRTIKPNVVIRRNGSAELLDVSFLTALSGGAAILLAEERKWEFSGTIATIENEEAFWRHHMVLPEIDLAIYVRGKMSNRLLQWLASAPMANCQITHWGDYDPIGVLEYVRLQRSCIGRVRLHVPDGLEDLVARFGKRRLVQSDKQTQALSSLRRVAGNEIVAQLVEMFERQGKGVEQEILLALTRPV